MKITLDTNVLIRSHGRAKGAARRVLEWIERSEHELVLSQSMIYELEEVLGYPQVRKVTGLTDEEMASYVAYVVKLAKLVDLGKPAVFSLQMWTIGWCCARRLKVRSTYSARWTVISGIHRSHLFTSIMESKS